MLETLRDLLAHKSYADAAMLTALKHHGGAASDPELLALLDHVLLSNRFWVLTVRGLPFVLEEESRASETFDELVARYASNQSQEREWLQSATDADLSRTLTSQFFPNAECTVLQAFMQVCLHSQGHRSQCAKMLRSHGGVPPTTDFILWLASRATARWPEASDPSHGQTD